MREGTNMRSGRAVRIARMAAIGILAIALFGLVVMSLWNWLLPPLFGVGAITFWQALGILILSKILFGSIHGQRGHRGRWRSRMNARWAEMTPEERERFRQGMFSGGRTGEMPPAATDPGTSRT